MSTVVGVSGARRNACVAACVDGVLSAACEQERLTRVRGAGIPAGTLPDEALDAVLRLAGRARSDVTTFVTAEEGIALPPGLPSIRLEHAYAHAATAFLTSPFANAAILVCDQGSCPELSVWLGEDTRIVDQQWNWAGPAFARLYSECSRLFGFVNGQEHRLEAVAQLGDGSELGDLSSVWANGDRRLRVCPGWEQRILDASAQNGSGPGAGLGSSIQRRLGEMLLEVVREIRCSVGASNICLGGGLFYNTYFTTLINRSGIFERTFVPVNPGNAGLAVGGVLAVASQTHGRPEQASSAFLGPEFDREQIKGLLDNCKLVYDLVSESEMIAATVEALAAGKVVGWFQGRMEWGHRALGHRSILANPLSPYVLDNLNVFLKMRERERAYGLSICQEDLTREFEGPPESTTMEYEYTARHPDVLEAVMPEGARQLRVQSINGSPKRFRDLHRAFADLTGAGVLVNTSFNGFQEPIVCSPRDAVRVFYGTALDMLVLDRFILRK